MTADTGVTVVTVRTTASAVVATLDDGKVNALGLEHVHGLRSAVAAASDLGLPLVLAGRPGALSAGFDLALVEAHDERFHRLLVETELLCLDLLVAPVPVVVACTGHAVAAGALLLLCADHRVGTTGDHVLGLTEVRHGLVLPDFALTLARARLDPRAFVRATVLGEALSPTEAVATGLLDAVADDPVAAAEAVAEDLAGLTGRALATTRRLAHGPTVEALLRQSLLVTDRQP